MQKIFWWIVPGIGAFLFFLALGSNNQPSPPPSLSPTPAVSPVAQAAHATPKPATRGEEAEVQEVIDGDTVKLADGRIVRYVGIDTPETGAGRRTVECFAHEATERNRQLVEGKRVRLEKDVSETDRYGRILRFVYLGDVFVNELLVKEGYATAFPYPPDVKYREVFRAAERTARASGRGMWGAACRIRH
ncbi:MAG: nuclease-like protein [Parcubacteria group bacterium Gr01-1014_38]|nr:MAG: nuclease-like protein [Parcubacteria group bacterium Gr01-1014_38]